MQIACGVGDLTLLQQMDAFWVEAPKGAAGDG
jgi:hypothetical protein